MVSFEQWSSSTQSHVHPLATPRPDYLPSSAESSVYTDARSSLIIMTSDVNLPSSLGGAGLHEKCHSREASATSARQRREISAPDQDEDNSNLVSLERLLVTGSKKRANYESSRSFDDDATTLNVEQYSVTREEMRENIKHWTSIRQGIQSLAASRSSSIPALVASLSSSSTTTTTLNTAGTNSNQTSPTSSVMNNLVSGVPRRDPNHHYPRPCSSVSERGFVLNVPAAKMKSWFETQQLQNPRIMHDPSPLVTLRTPATYQHQLGYARCNSRATSATLNHKRRSSTYYQHPV